MLLVIDVGNTSMVWGVYKQDVLVARWHTSTCNNRSANEYGVLINKFFRLHAVDATSIKGVAISCVVPAVLDALLGMCHTYLQCNPLVISANIDLGLRILYEPPESLGADRLVNAYAAMCKYGRPVIVVDLGTATKFEAVSRDAEYLGGAIAPGVQLSLEALAQKTAKLPRVELTRISTAIANNTIDAIRSGVIYGTAGQVDAIIRHIKKEMGPPTPRVVATGGNAHIISSVSTEVQVFDDQLTLDGLYLAYQRASAADIVRKLGRE